MARRLAVWCGALIAVAPHSSAADRGWDPVLEPVAIAELEADAALKCVVVLPEGWTDHSRDGGVGQAMEEVSPALLKRLRRHRASLTTYGGSECPDPVLWLGPVRWDDAAQTVATVWVGEVGPPNLGRVSYTVRRTNLKWSATRNCCLE
jgi:hypothetical protein